MLNYVVLGEDKEGKVTIEHIEAVCERSARDQFTRRHIGKNIKINEARIIVDNSAFKVNDYVEIISAKEIHYDNGLTEIKTEYIGARGFISNIDVSNECPYKIEFTDKYSYLNKQTGFTWSAEQLKIVV